MARVTPSEVEDIFENSDSIDLNPHITAANLIVTNVLGNEGLSAETLIEIERWLAAHFACARLPMEDSMRMGDASIKIQGAFGKYLDSTSYGQRVLLLDTSGRLASSRKPGARFAALSHDETPNN